MNQDERHLLDELRYDIQRSDHIKAITLTKYLGTCSEELHRAFIDLLMQADFSFSSQVLLSAIRAGAGKLFQDALRDALEQCTAEEVVG